MKPGLGRKSQNDPCGRKRHIEVGNALKCAFRLRDSAADPGIPIRIFFFQQLEDQPGPRISTGIGRMSETRNFFARAQKPMNQIADTSSKQSLKQKLGPGRSASMTG